LFVVNLQKSRDGITKRYPRVVYVSENVWFDFPLFPGQQIRTGPRPAGHFAGGTRPLAYMRVRSVDGPLASALPHMEPTLFAVSPLNWRYASALLAGTQWNLYEWAAQWNRMGRKWMLGPGTQSADIAPTVTHSSCVMAVICISLSYFGKKLQCVRHVAEINQSSPSQEPNYAMLWFVAISLKLAKQMS